MKVNIGLLRAKIVEKGTTQGALATAIHMDRSTFSRKMKCDALEFSIGEMHQIVSILQLTKQEATDIFLSQ